MKLGSRAASRLAVVALSHGLELKATRIAKAPLRHAGEINRLALLTLEDTHAQPLGIDALTLELSSLSWPAKQGALWPHKERLEQAVAAVEARYPGAILKLSQDDPYALASEHRYHCSTGEEVSRAERPTAAERHDRRQGQPVEA